MWASTLGDWMQDAGRKKCGYRFQTQQVWRQGNSIRNAGLLFWYAREIRVQARLAGVHNSSERKKSVDSTPCVEQSLFFVLFISLSFSRLLSRSLSFSPATFRYLPNFCQVFCTTIIISLSVDILLNCICLSLSSFLTVCMSVFFSFFLFPVFHLQ